MPKPTDEQFARTIKRAMEASGFLEKHPMPQLKIKPTKADDIDAALELVIDLAEQNIIDRYDNPGEYRKQMAALKLVRETFSKSGGL